MPRRLAEPVSRFRTPRRAEALPVPASPVRVLLIAEMCNPDWSSVPLVGYNMAAALAARPELRVHLATHVRNREALAAKPIPHLAETTFIDNEWLAAPMHQFSRLLRGGRKPAWTLDTASQWPGYILFERLLARTLAGDLERNRFDIIHRLTPLSPTIPSPLARQTHTPMVLGPLNGGLSWPKQYPLLRSQEGEWLQPVRFLYKLLPFHRSSYARMSAVISGSRHTQKELPAAFRGLRFYLPENGVDTSVFTPRAAKPANRPFRFIGVGRLVPYKGFDLILEAMAGDAVLKQCELVLVGEGPEKARLKELAKLLGISDRLTPLGWLDQEAVNEQFHAADAFVFPSLREFGGGVVLEAMATGLPSIVVDYGGPGELLDDESGIRLPMAPRDRLVPQLREAMRRLHDDSDLRETMGEAAVRRVQDHFTWEAKARAVVRFYREIIEDRQAANP